MMIRLLIIVAACCIDAKHEDARCVLGINLPPKSVGDTLTSDSGTVNFLAGVYHYGYTPEEIARIKRAGFTALRLGFNIETANDPQTLREMRGYIDEMPGTSVVCMWDTDYSRGPGTDHWWPSELLPWMKSLLGKGHDDGQINDLAQATEAWRKVAAAMQGADVMFEIFNEPTYGNVDGYMQDIKAIIEGASLPLDQCIVHGVQTVQDLIDACLPNSERPPNWRHFGEIVDETIVDETIYKSWSGALSYHIYPDTGASDKSSWVEYGVNILDDIDEFCIDGDVWITEFGSSLDLPDYTHQGGSEGDVNMLIGMEKALQSQQDRGYGVRGIFYWHGWDNGGSDFFFGKENTKGARKVADVMMTAADQPNSMLIHTDWQTL